jgi:DNA-binding XRE family transcriptional regulator
MDQLAEKSGVSKSQISRIEGEQRNWSIDSLTKIAEALGVSPTELLVLSDAWFDAPILGIIIDGGYYTASPNGSVQETIKVPAALGDVLVLRVETDSLQPRYGRGEHVLVQKQPAEPKAVLGRECLVFMTNGHSVLRTIVKGSRPKLYTLTTHNQPPMRDVGILTCRPVVRL